MTLSTGIHGADVVLGRLHALGLSLPPAAPSRALFRPYRISGKTVYLAGQISEWNGVVTCAGKLGRDLDVEQGRKAAETCMLNLLFHLRAAAGGSFSAVAQCVRVGGFVNCEPGFPDSPKVIDGASALLIQLFGERGEHARTAVGVAGLPANGAVEVDAVFELL
jgi:enamine deaminase RidA (YjgF/YER057c/UK114 family)